MLPLPRPFHVMGRRPFLDVSTGEPIHVRLPDLYGRHHLLGSTAEGFLVLCRRDTLAVHLLNPLTGHRAASADLPRVTTLLNLKAESVPRTSEAPGSPATRRSRFTFTTAAAMRSPSPGRATSAGCGFITSAAR
ncbi:unnamed protein product [Urochloa humidicola]